MSSRRIIDILVAAAALILLSPLLCVVAVAVSLDSRGGPFYGARRVGKDSRVFRMWKFRTMIVGADKCSAITATGDSRITRIGAILRKTKLDELPQFWNLLVGDLTIVGPRPEEPRLVERYTPLQSRVLKIKPGITGPSQIEFTGAEAAGIAEGPDTEAFYMERFAGPKVERDLKYAQNRTFFSDLVIVIKTCGLMLRAFVKYL